MINTIKNFKWFFSVSFLCVILGVFTFITFINQGFLFLNEDNLQYLLMLDVTLLLIFLLLLIQETSKLYTQYSKKRSGSKTSINYVLQFSLFAFLPSLVIAIFSLVLFNVGLQKYFDKRITSAVNNSYQVAKNYIEETQKTVETDIYLISQDLNRYSQTFFSSPKRFSNIVRAQKNLRKVDDLYIFDSSGTVLLADVSNPEDEFPIPSEEIFEKALEGNPVSVNLSKENKTAFIIKLGNFIDTYLYISKNIQPQLLQYLDETEQAVNFYYTVENNRTGIKITFAIIYIIIVSLLLFLTIVLAVTFAQRLTKPIINLISASKNISAGKLDSRVPDIDADEEIKSLNQNFNNMIERLKKQQDKLLVAERYSAWESVARKLAHEIKNPLTPIQLSIDSLKEKYSDQLKDKSKNFDNYLSTINRQIKDIEKLVNEFSDFARMPKPIFRENNLVDIIHENINLLKELDNSIEAIEEKKQKDKNLQGKIVVEIDRNNEYIVIKMLDNGPGFNDTKNITKPYYTTKTKGTGLGLPIVSKIINEHNGDINFLKKTSGAIIEIYLPAI